MTATNPQSARTCTIISWVLFGAGTALYAVLFFVYGAAGLMGLFTTGPSY
ncbi:hypothetical protein [Nocardiopsis sp. RV163]|nr:hypothetical protein [Nocardiopsis sp. RV163]